MSDRVKMIIQKRSSLKSQITNLNNNLDKGKSDNTSLKLRITRLTDLYHAFEDLNDELAILDSNETHDAEFVIIQEHFYLLAARVEDILKSVEVNKANNSTSNTDTQVDNEISIPVKKWRNKLPEAALPTFDGKYENWLSFKNAFHNMISSQGDLTDIDKLQYLKSALVGEAANKVRIFSIDGINYSHAWDVLERIYEVKRVLISRHLESILNLSVLDKETAKGLNKLADDMQKHVASLNTLGVSVGSEILVHIIESKLPKTTLEKWEITLERDEFPKPDQIYEFLYKAAVCASKREISKEIESDRIKLEPLIKRKRIVPSSQAFILNTSRNCVICKVKRHPLYLCERFRQLSVQKRIEAVKNAKDLL